MLLSEVAQPTKFVILWRVEGTFYKGDVVAVSEKQAIDRVASRIANRIFGGYSYALAKTKFKDAIKGTPIVNPAPASPELGKAIAV